MNSASGLELSLYDHSIVSLQSALIFSEKDRKTTWGGWKKIAKYARNRQKVKRCEGTRRNHIFEKHVRCPEYLVSRTHSPRCVPSPRGLKAAPTRRSAVALQGNTSLLRDPGHTPLLLERLLSLQNRELSQSDWREETIGLLALEWD